MSLGLFFGALASQEEDFLSKWSKVKQMFEGTLVIEEVVGFN